ncbi:bystin-like [Rosa sericea]
MTKKRGRERHRNPKPFLAEDDVSVASTMLTKQPKMARKRQENLVLSAGMSSKILREAQIQEKEIEEEENTNAFTEEPHNDEEDDDDFDTFLETHREDEANKVMEAIMNETEDEDEEKLLERFLSNEEGDDGPQRNLANLILATIKNKQYDVTSDARSLVKMDTDFIELYKGVAKFMKSYSAGKIAKPFKFIPAMQQWEDALYFTEPDNWSPTAMYETTRILASNLTPQKRFYKHVLLPRVRQDIRNKKKKKPLHFSLYQSLKKSVHKRAAFFKGILLPLCQSRTCTLKEASVVGSIIQKVRISASHAGAAIMMLAEMEYSRARSYFIKLLLEKQYALPNPVIEALVAHFMRSVEEPRVMPVIWHQSLLAFVQR